MSTTEAKEENTAPSVTSSVEISLGNIVTRNHPTEPGMRLMTRTIKLKNLDNTPPWLVAAIAKSYKNRIEHIITQRLQDFKSSSISAAVTITRVCDFCHKAIKKDDEYITLENGDDKCFACQNKITKKRKHDDEDDDEEPTAKRINA